MNVSISLDKYQRDNLIALLHLIVTKGVGLDNGDWVCEIYNQLAVDGYDPIKHHPNMTPAEMLKSIREAVR